jgi:hypothetical protein
MYQSTWNSTTHSTIDISLGKYPRYPVTYAFNFETQEWEQIDALGSDTSDDPTGRRYFFLYDVTSFPNDVNGDWKMGNLKFNTYNHRSDLKDKNTGEYYDFIKKKGSPLHTHDTVYYLEFMKGSVNQNRDISYITLDEVNIVDTSYENLDLYDYEKLKVLFEHFDSMGVGNASRDISYSSGYHDTSGGTRIPMTESHGGAQLGDNDSGSYMSGKSGVVYEVEDD